MSTKSRFRGLAELQVIENIDDIELRRPRGAPSRAFHADTGARRGALASISEESRSSKSSKTLTKSTFGGFEELQVGNSTRTRERDGGLQPPIERLVYIYIYINIFMYLYAFGMPYIYVYIYVKHAYICIYIYIYICILDARWGAEIPHLARVSAWKSRPGILRSLRTSITSFFR